MYVRAARFGGLVETEVEFPRLLPLVRLAALSQLSRYYLLLVINGRELGGVCLLVDCLTSQQHARVSQGRICSDNFTRCHTEIEVADQTFHLTQSQYTDTEPTSPSADPLTPGAWPLERQFLNRWYNSTPKKFRRKRGSNPGFSALEADALTTRPKGRYTQWRRGLSEFSPVDSQMVLWVRFFPRSA